MWQQCEDLVRPILAAVPGAVEFVTSRCSNAPPPPPDGSGDLCEDMNDLVRATAGFGCGMSVQAVGCEYDTGAGPLSQYCPESCGLCGGPPPPPPPPPAPDSQWLVGEEGSNNCPEGFETISSPADCETAALATGFEFNDPPQSYCCGHDKPSGCWAGRLGKANFNDVVPGAAFAGGRLLCRRSETDDPAAGGGGSPGDAGGATACGGSALRVHGGEAVRSPRPYTGNLDCEWLITCPQSRGSPSHASLQFTSFSTETETDVLHIFSGGIGSTTPLLVGGTGTRAHCQEKRS